MEINIAVLYPDLLNLYGDKGNIITLKKRLETRGISAKVTEYSIDDNIDFSSTDIVYIGGGSDREQLLVCKKLCEIKEELKAYVEDGGTVLAVCSGFQLLGNYYETENEKIEATAILDIYTSHSKERLIGDIILQSPYINSTIVGFENHSGRTNIGSCTPLGSVTCGYGNNGSKDYEGVVYKNVIATYIHGPLLPKNPILADKILLNAINKKYGISELEKIDDTFEIVAHNYILEKYQSK